MRIAVLADSILAGPGQSLPAVYEAIELMGVEAEVINHAVPWRLLRQNLVNVEAVIVASPDVVILGHGGSEAMTTRRPHGGGITAQLAAESPRAARRRDLIHRALGRNGRPAVRFGQFEADMRRVVRDLVERSSALVILQGPSGVAHDQRPSAVRNRALGIELCRALEDEYPQRVRVLWLSTVLRQWEDFRADQTHLSPSGHSAVARMIAECVTAAQRSTGQ